jgi:hypothetical protein
MATAMISMVVPSKTPTAPKTQLPKHKLQEMYVSLPSFFVSCCSFAFIFTLSGGKLGVACLRGWLVGWLVGWFCLKLTCPTIIFTSAGHLNWACK